MAPEYRARNETAASCAGLIEDGWNGSAAVELVVVDMVASCGDLDPGQVGARRQPDEAVDSHDATPTPSTRPVAAK
ncbi:hypothetical protein GCM10011509_29810 [Ornithinimicrobium pekingense]|uniref:Uncharacterized protein n=1 Tax=Ornithinimicrobium pekingense TaxID=384677 RepID=A0ABQ2FB59_9MICO|nr:hypothetical protein GCM10011509_29810 [Ornithinimicrobium pekingense]